MEVDGLVSGCGSREKDERDVNVFVEFCVVVYMAECSCKVVVCPRGRK